MSALPPNGPLQVVFSFDTTGSMSRALKEVRGRLSDMLQRLQTDIPAVTTAVVAHGDYCDEGSTYITKHVDFTNNLPQLVNFVNDVQETFGGDEPEAYEVMLRLVRTQLTWTPGSQRVLVVIGDAFPHAVDEAQNKDKIDWRQETLGLHDMVSVVITSGSSLSLGLKGSSLLDNGTTESNKEMSNECSEELMTGVYREINHFHCP